MFDIFAWNNTEAIVQLSKKLSIMFFSINKLINSGSACK